MGSPDHHFAIVRQAVLHRTAGGRQMGEHPDDGQQLAAGPGVPRRRMLAVLMLTALLPVVAVVIVSLRTVGQLAGIAAERAQAALAGEVEAQLQGQAQDAAIGQGAVLEQLTAQATSLSTYAAVL